MKMLESIEEYDELRARESDYMIFKNSATCSISGGACQIVYQAVADM